MKKNGSGKFAAFLGIIGIVLVLTVGIAFANSNQNSNESQIKKVIHKNGGEMTSIEEKVFNHGPFIMKSNTQHIYYFTYTEKGQKKEGWASRIVAMPFCEPRSCIGRLSS